MTKSSSSSFHKSILIKTLICFSFLKLCTTTTALYFNFDLSSVSLDPPITGFTITGNANSDALGMSVNTAGDINKDGYDDIIVGARGKGSNRGAVYVIYGGPKFSISNLDLGSLTLDPHTTGFTLIGATAGENFGRSVSTAGDINKDGYSDIIIGAPQRASNRGAAYVIYGGPKSSMVNLDLSSVTLDPATTGFVITGNASPDNFGFSVSTAGDINNDGYDDIIVGAYMKSTSTGAAYVVYGGPKSSMQNIDLSSDTLDPLTTGFMITGGAPNDRFGFSVSTAGDINKDGYDDIIIGANGKSNSKGIVYVVYGGPKSSMSNIDLSSDTLYPLTTGFMITGNSDFDYFGYSAKTAGDINKDGYDDIIVGAYGKSGAKGAAYIVYGGPKPLMPNIDLSMASLNPLTTGFMITGNAGSDRFGISVSSTGDINKDGYNDVIIGAYGKSSYRGAAYLIYGGKKSSMSNIDLSSQTLDPLTTGFMITGNAASNNFGFSVSTAGDFDSDGYGDIIIGAYGNTSQKGAAYLIHTACSPCWSCPAHCNQCGSSSSCFECKSPFLLYESQCVASCPASTFPLNKICKDCPPYCSSCISQETCITCEEGYVLSKSICVVPSLKAEAEAAQAISSATQGIGSVLSTGRAIFPRTALVSKIVQNTRYLNLSVTDELADIYQTWDTNIISWEVPNVFSSQDNFEKSPPLFARYDLGSPFLVNFSPTLMNIGIGFVTFITCFLLRKVFEETKYTGWAYSLVQKLVAGSFNFALAQTYGCLDDILFYLVLDAKTNPFNTLFSWTSLFCAIGFLAIGCFLVWLNFWKVRKYQEIKGNNQDLKAFNERNKYWELFYSDFNDDGLLSQSFFALLIMRSTLSSFIITVLYDYPLMQTSYLVVLDGAILLLLFYKTPFNTLRGKLAQYYYEIITLLVHICTFLLSFQDSLKRSSDALRTVLSTGIIYLNTALVTGGIGFMFIEIYKTISQKTKAGKPKQYESIAIQTVALEGRLDAQGSALGASQAQHFKIINLTKQENCTNHHQSQSLENSHLLSGSHQNSNISGNMESSQAPDPNLSADSSFLWDMDPRNRIYPLKDQSTAPVVIRR